VYRLDKARQQFVHGDEVTVVHRSFELDPHAPARRTQSMNEMLASKYGMSPEQIRAGHERMTAMGHEVGMEFNFERIQMGSTFDAHRLVQAARGTDVEEALVKRLFGAYFTDGELLSDHEVLLRAAAAVGMDGDLAAGALDGDARTTDARTTDARTTDARTTEVREDEAVAHELGITGVPYFLFNGKWAVPGAQDVDTMVRALERAWERTEPVESAEGLAQAGTAAN
jgi:predicted DsbA family dithiol-disulfide isomerase